MTLAALEPRSWHDDWSTLTVAIVGLGPEGFALADTLAEKGAKTAVFCQSPHPDYETILSVLGVSSTVSDEVDYLRARVEQFRPHWIVPTTHDDFSMELVEVLKTPVNRVVSLAEISLRLGDKVPPRCRSVFIGGGVEAGEIAALAGRFLHHAGIRVALAGGEYPPALDALRMPEGLDVLLWCLAPRELDDMAADVDSLRSPEVSVATGHETLSPEQLLALYANTVHACIYRRGDETERALEGAFVIDGARAIGFGLDSPGMSDFGIVEDIVCDRAFLEDRRTRALEITTLGELSKAGFQTPIEVERALAACAIARSLGTSPEVIGGVLRVLGGS